MAITEERPTAAAGLPADDGWRRWDRIAGRLLAVGSLCAAVLLLAVGERDGSYEHLANDLRAGDVDQVEVVGLTDAGVGPYATLRWRDGLVMRTAEVKQATDERAARRARRESTQPVVVGPVTDHLTALDPDVRIMDVERRYYSQSIYGWSVPGALVLLILVLFVDTLSMILGPRPWRATRWAWLVLMVPLVGVPAYLLFGGPTGLFRPKSPHRPGLTGGWAFLLALLLGGGAASR